ncbi:MAG: hypothetical protein J7K69_08245 [Thermotogae bacterium]|nr:hypothetical protein [Thermotogota bacterium]
MDSRILHSLYEDFFSYQINVNQHPKSLSFLSIVEHPAKVVILAFLPLQRIAWMNLSIALR